MLVIFWMSGGSGERCCDKLLLSFGADPHVVVLLLVDMHSALLRAIRARGEYL